MLKVSIEVRSGITRFPVSVRAESIQRAVDLVEQRFPDHDAAVRFPIDPEAFFTEASALLETECEQKPAVRSERENERGQRSGERY